jgi:hypothetical protein
MKQALRHLLEDFLSAMLFSIAYAVSRCVRTAAGVAGLIQSGRLYFAAWQIEFAICRFRRIVRRRLTQSAV